MNRRLFLKGSAFALATFGLSSLPGFARRALALSPDAQGSGGKRRTLVFLFLTGGLDGLSALIPYGERGFLDLRPNIAPPPPGHARGKDGPLADPMLPLEDGLGLHPALAPLLPLYQDKVLAFVHAAGQPNGTRSHFDAQDFLELGTPGDKSTSDGWLSRALQLAEAQGIATPLEAVALSQHLPRSLQGRSKAFAFGNLGAVRLRPLAGGPGGDQGRSAARDAFEAMYDTSDDAALSGAGKEAFEALTMLEQRLGKEFAQPRDGVVYPGGPAAGPLRQIAALVKANVGLRVAAASVGGWDTHVNQPGELSRRFGELSKALTAFWADLGPSGSEVLLVAVTEFGRTVQQNGSNGTDHGTGSMAILLGGEVAGGKVYGRWPGVQRAQLFEGRDLAVTTDVRGILAKAAEAQLGVRDFSRLFPGYRGDKLGFVRS